MSSGHVIALILAVVSAFVLHSLRSRRNNNPQATLERDAVEGLETEREESAKHGAGPRKPASLIEHIFDSEKFNFTGAHNPSGFSESVETVGTGPEASNSLTSGNDNTLAAQAEADRDADVSKAKQSLVDKHESNDVEQRLPKASLMASPTASQPLPPVRSLTGSHHHVFADNGPEKRLTSVASVTETKFSGLDEDPELDAESSIEREGSESAVKTQAIINDAKLQQDKMVKEKGKLIRAALEVSRKEEPGTSSMVNSRASSATQQGSIATKLGGIDGFKEADNYMDPYQETQASSAMQATVHTESSKEADHSVGTSSRVVQVLTNSSEETDDFKGSSEEIQMGRVVTKEVAEGNMRAKELAEGSAKELAEGNLPDRLKFEVQFRDLHKDGASDVKTEFKEVTTRTVVSRQWSYVPVYPPDLMYMAYAYPEGDDLGNFLFYDKQGKLGWIETAVKLDGKSVDYQLDLKAISREPPDCDLKAFNFGFQDVKRLCYSTSCKNKNGKKLDSLSPSCWVFEMKDGAYRVFRRDLKVFESTWRRWTKRSKAATSKSILVSIAVALYLFFSE